jgi:hypothetical protein
MRQATMTTGREDARDRAGPNDISMGRASHRILFDETVTATVTSDTKINFEGGEISLSNALTLPSGAGRQGGASECMGVYNSE